VGKKVLIAFATLALTVASAANSFRITLFQDSKFNGTQLKPGEYKIELRENKAVLKQGKIELEATVKVETNSNKYRATSVKYANGSDIQEIRIGGTATRLVFEN
jgi:hypothetical protein